MEGVAIIVLIVIALGLGFLGVEASARASLRRRGPWLIAAVACVISTIVLNTYDTEFTSLWHVLRRNQFRDLLATLCITALLAIEAAFISRWAIKTMRRKPTYLVTFSFATLLAWLLTFLALWDVVPSS